MRLVLSLSLMMLMAGCDAPSSPASAPVDAPATRRSDDVPATAPSTRPTSVMTIDQQKYEFPPALLRLKKLDDQYRVFLTSDDPREAFHSDYQGHSFYFELPNLINDPADLLDEPIVLRADGADRRDTADGIFLHGNTRQLQPQDAKIEIKGSGDALEVWISGTFMMFTTREASDPGRLVPVTAHLTAQVK